MQEKRPAFDRRRTRGRLRSKACRSAHARQQVDRRSIVGESSLEKLERVKGIEPSFQAWEAHVLPLNHTRVPETACYLTAERHTGKRVQSNLRLLCAGNGIER
jgi:hypothetical protein